MYYNPSLTYPVPVDTSWDIQDGSKIKTYMECPRKYFYEYVLGWRSIHPSNHLIFGEAWHKAMEILYDRGFSNDNVLAAYNEGFLPAYRAHFDPGDDELFHPKTPERAFIAIALYANTYKTDLIENRVLEYNGQKLIELGGKINISEKHVVCFRQDTILENDRGIFSLDHKTGSLSYNWATQWELAPATAIYTHVLYCMFLPEKVSGIKYNGMIFKKTKDDPKKDLADPFRHFETIRAPIYKSPQQIGTMLVNLIWYLDMISMEFDRLSECSDSDQYLSCYPQNWLSCLNWGRSCEYHDFCCNWSNPLRYIDRLPMDIKIDFWNPLTEQPKVEVSL